MKILKWLNEHLEEYLSCSLLAVITVVMFAQIIMRYIFGSAFSWAEELSRYCYIWIVFLSAGFCVLKDNELRVNIIVEHLPRILRGIFRIAGQVIITAFYAYMAYHSYFVVLNMYSTMRRSAAIEIPMYIMYSACLIGFALGAARGVQKLYRGRHVFFKPGNAGAEDDDAIKLIDETGGEIV